MLLRSYQNRRVLVTGHTGFKGSWLSQWLLNLGADVAGYSLYIPSNPSLFETLSLEGQINSVKGDIRNIEALGRVINDFRPEVIFHLAAQPIVSTAIAQPVESFETNLMGAVNVLECVRQAESVKSCVIITSDKCYENVEWEYGYRESDALGGKDPYSASKACAEIAFHSYFRTYLRELSGRTRFATGRAGNVIGGGDWAKDRIVPDCVKAWGQGQSVVIRSPQATRPWQHVLEPLSGYLSLGAEMLGDRGGLNGESFNFGPGPDTNHTVNSLLEEMAKTWPGNQWENHRSVLSGKEAGLLKLNCDKALSRLRWSPTLSFAETIAMTASWYRSYYQGRANMVDLTKQQIADYTRLAKERQKQWAL